MFNQILVMGYLGKAPVLKKTNTGKSVVEFSLASTEKRMVKGVIKDHTEWFKVTFWGDLAETIAEHVKQGQPLMVQGNYRSDTFIDGEGLLRHTSRILGERFMFLPKERLSTEPPAVGQQAVPAPVNDDCPF